MVGRIGLGAVVVIAGIVAVAASRGSSNDTATRDRVEQTRPVEVTGTSLAPLAGGGSDPAVGQPVPELRGRSFDGAPVTVTRDGRAKLVLFVAHWCPHCQREVPLLSDYLRTSSLPAGIDVVTVATRTNSSRPNYPPSAWLDRESWPTAVLADDPDSTAAQAFGLPGYPYFVASTPMATWSPAHPERSALTSSKRSPGRHRSEPPLDLRRAPRGR